MEKDSKARDSNSDEDPSEISSSQHLQMSDDNEIIRTTHFSYDMPHIMDEKRLLEQSLQELQEKQKMNSEAIALIKSIVSQNACSNLDSPLGKDRKQALLQNMQATIKDIISSLGYNVNIVPSHNQKSLNLPSDTSETLPDATVVTGILEHPGDIFSEPGYELRLFDTQIQETPSKTLEDISKVREDTQGNSDTLVSLLTSDISPRKLMCNEANETGMTDIDLKNLESPQSPDAGLFLTPTHVESSRSNKESCGSSGGKGKEAANIKFRYKKKSKTESSPSQSSDNRTPVKDSSIELESPDFKKLVLESPRSKLSDTSEGDRKELHSSEKKINKRQSDDSCEKTETTWESSRVSSNDGTTVVKKLKFERETPTSSSPFVRPLLQKTDKNIVMSKFMDQLQPHQSHMKSKEPMLPSTSSVSKVVVSPDISSSGGSSLVTVEDYSLGEYRVASIVNVDVMDQLQPHQSDIKSEERILQSISGISDVVVSEFSCTDKSSSGGSSFMAVDDSLAENRVASIVDVMDQLQPHQSAIKSEGLMLPSTSGVSNVFVSDFSIPDKSSSDGSSFIAVDDSLADYRVASIINVDVTDQLQPHQSDLKSEEHILPSTSGVPSVAVSDISRTDKSSSGGSSLGEYKVTSIVNVEDNLSLGGSRVKSFVNVDDNSSLGGSRKTSVVNISPVPDEESTIDAFLEMLENP